MEFYFPCDLLGLEKCALLNDIPDHGHCHSNGNQPWGTWSEHFRMVLEQYPNMEMVCSRNVPEQTFLWNSSIKTIDACSRIVLEQTVRLFMKLY